MDEKLDVCRLPESIQDQISNLNILITSTKIEVPAHTQKSKPWIQCRILPNLQRRINSAPQIISKIATEVTLIAFAKLVYPNAKTMQRPKKIFIDQYHLWI